MSFTRASEFAAVARALQGECARLGIKAPAFRSPPHQSGPRSIRRCPDGVVVAVRLDRDEYAVTSDLIDGCIAANPDLDREAVELIRSELWLAAGAAVAA